MLKEIKLSENGKKGNVLILILMEHAQRDAVRDMIENNPDRVLILILMEHAQRAIVGVTLSERAVLILILMEHAQRDLYIKKLMK